MAHVPVFPSLRVRLYLVDVPDGSARRILAVAVVARTEDFDAALDAFAPILGSVDVTAR